MDSGSILLANLGWQQFHGQSMQSAMMYSGMGNMMGAQGLMGGLMSQGAAVGAPLMSGIGGMMGLDPLSLGLKAGGLAWKGGAGVLGAGMAGMGAMAGVGVLGAGAAWAGGQMLSGAQQQMALSRGMAQNYNFMNPAGGQGFMPQQSMQIGREIREMTHDLGGGGEIATFSELSRLAVNMGRMGMGQNVRTVKDFKEKFKQMVDSVKTIATELGTSLEEAQKMMASMRQVGIFKPGQAVQASKLMRETALSGGLAMSEVSSMMNIGSQISRSVGGLGQSGAIGGARTIGQIGTALQMGVISEEGIYNATGLTGAEGRQAFATEMMSRSANFLRSGRGRRFLASVAGKDGTLNADAVMEWMSGGGVGTGRTMELAGKNLAGVGRANFIRNEGRLRGSALEQFGGMLQPMVYKQWLSERGWDPTDMDDRSKLAFQRFSGLGRDEADQALSVVARMPEIMQQQRRDAGMTKWADENKLRSQQTGVEGVKRKLEQMREGLQGKLQQYGAEIMKSGSDVIESWLSKVTGIYQREYTAEMDRAFRGYMSGTATGMQAFNRQFGQIAPKGMFAAGGPSMKSATPADFYGGGGGLLGAFFESPAERYKKAGYKFDEGMSMDDIRKRMDEVDRITARSVAAPTKEVLDLGKRHERMLRNIEGSVTGRGEERLASYKKVLRERAEGGDKEADNLLHKLETTWGGPGAQMALLSGMQEGAEMGGARDLWGKPEGPGFDSKLSQMTESERAKAYGNMLAGGKGGRTWTGSWAARGLLAAGAVVALPFAVAGAAGAALWGGIGSAVTGKNLFSEGFDYFDQKMEDWFGSGPTSSVKERAGEQFNLEENQELIAKLHGTSKEERDEGFKTVTNRLNDLMREKSKSGKDLSDAKKGEELFLRSAKASQVYADLWQKHGGKIPDKVLEDTIKDEELRNPTTGQLMSVSDFKQLSEGLLASAENRRGEKFMTAAKEWGGRAEKDIESYTSTGVAKYDESGVLTLSKGVGDFDFKGQEDINIINNMLRAKQEQARMKTAGDPKAAARALRESKGFAEDARSRWKNKSVAQKREFAARLRAVGMEDEAQDVLYSAGIDERLAKASAQGAAGRMKFVDQVLGAGLSADERKMYLGAASKGGDEMKAAALSLSKRAGVSQEDAEKLLVGIKGGKGKDADFADLIDRLTKAQDKKNREEKEKSDPSLQRLDAIKASIEASGDKVVNAIASLSGYTGPKKAGQPGEGTDKPPG